MVPLAACDCDATSLTERDLNCTVLFGLRTSWPIWKFSPTSFLRYCTVSRTSSLISWSTACTKSAPQLHTSAIAVKLAETSFLSIT